MCWKLLTKLFKRVRKHEPLPQPKRKPRKWWEFPFRRINTSLGFLNMPRYQPCPACAAGAKRQFKTEVGASYLCRCKNRFVVSR